MTAVSSAPGIARPFKTLSNVDFTLASGEVAYQNAYAAVKLGTGTVVAATGASDELLIGKFNRYVDASAGAKSVSVNLIHEIEADWQANGAVAAAATDLGAICYVQDDQTVSMSPTAGGKCVAGRIWGFDSVKGVLVEILRPVPNTGLVETSPGAFASNDLVIDDYPEPGAVFDIPATGAASTVTLPAAAREGTELTFVADGTKNGHTVQYRDATGPANLTTALLASKRHLVKAVFLNGIWTANAYVSP